MASLPPSAPPVVYPLGRSRFEARLLALAWLAGALLGVAWAIELARFDWRLLCGGAALLAAGATAWAGLRQRPAGELVWDGRGWSHGGAAVGLEVTADFQRALLLRLARPGARPLWCWVERAFLPERWADLRRAAHARARDAAAAVAVSAHPDSDSAPANP